MILTEYNEKLHNKTLKEEGIEEGIEIGKEEGIKIGTTRGIEIGTERTFKLANTIFKLHKSGKSYEEIAKAMGMSVDQIRKLLD